MKTLKTYVLTVSRFFPKTHKRAGEPTYFIEKINNAIGDTESCNVVVHSPNGDIPIWPKLHTIRSNYELWKKRIDEVNAGNAVLSLRYWSGKPYNSKQVEFHQLQRDECGVQEIEFGQIKGSLIPMFEGMANRTTCIELTENDGLQLEDFKEWFKGYDLSEPMAIIHFTNFRY